MSKNPKNCLEGISEDMAQRVVAFYSEPNSQKQTAKQFGLTMHTLIRLLGMKLFKEQVLTATKKNGKTVYFLCLVA